LFPNKQRIFSTTKHKEMYGIYLNERNKQLNPPSVCFDCYYLQLNHRNVHERTTIYLLNFKIFILVCLSLMGYFVVKKKVERSDFNGDLMSSSIYDNSKSEVYGLSKEEILRRKEEISSRTSFGDSSNNSFVKSPFKQSLVEK